MAKRKKPENPNAEKKYWEKESATFRKKHPGIYRQSRARERIVKVLSKPLSQWRKSKRQNVKNWQAIENYLLSGKATPKKLLEMLINAQKNTKKTLEVKESFLKMRAVATKMSLNKKDWNAIRRVLAMKDLKAEINSEWMFFGRMKDFGKAGKLAQFGELLVRLKVSHDKKYAIYKQKVSLAGMGLETQIKRTNKRIKELADIYSFGKINAIEYLRQSLLAEYALTYQYFNLTQSGEKLYAYLERKAIDKDLKKILGRMKREMNRRKLFYSSERTKIEHEFSKKDSNL